MIMNVEPVYGNGWTDGAVTLHEPPPFQIETDGSGSSKEIRGRVVTQGHPLSGFSFEASLHFRSDRETYNCCLSQSPSTAVKDSGELIYGYCYISAGSVCHNFAV